MICTFFGHRNTPYTVRSLLEKQIRLLIENKNVDYFIVGNNGSFDIMVRSVLIKLCKEYCNIKYNVVLAYMPVKKYEFDTTDYSDTIYPIGLETIPKKFAIPYRNRLMIKRCDYVIAYVNHNYGGAYKFMEYAFKQNKKVINLYKLL